MQSLSLKFVEFFLWCERSVFILPFLFFPINWRSLHIVGKYTFLTNVIVNSVTIDEIFFSHLILFTLAFNYSLCLKNMQWIDFVSHQLCFSVKFNIRMYFIAKPICKVEIVFSHQSNSNGVPTLLLLKLNNHNENESKNKSRKKQCTNKLEGEKRMILSNYRNVSLSWHFFFYIDGSKSKHKRYKNKKKWIIKNDRKGKIPK